MSGASRTRDFFENGSSGQFEWVLGFYDEAVRMKAESKSSKPENVIKLDKWYQTELPKKIKARGKEAHLIHDELVQTIKWKLARGKFFPQLTNLVRINTPKAVQSESRKAFRKLPNVEQAIATLTNLKGVGTTLASAVLAAGAPHLAPFMADECLLAMPDGDSLDYTMKEYMRFVEYVQSCVERLKAQGGDWNPHKVELAVWTHAIINEYKAEILIDMPGKNAAPPVSSSAPVTSSAASSNNGTDQENGASTSDEECGTKNATSSISNGEDSVSSPPPASFSTPSPSETGIVTSGNGNGNHGEFDEDSNAAKNGDFSLPPSDHDENSVPDLEGVTTSNDAVAVNDVAVVSDVTVNDVAINDVAVVKNGSDRVSSPEEESVSEITLPASNGDAVKENGNKEISSEKVSETTSNPSSPPPSIHPTETEPLAKRAASPEEQDQPATKKFKPEEEQQPQQQQQPEALATAVV